MKNILTISFLSLYVILSVGVNIAVHTCGGESTALIATNNAEDPCGCGDESKTDDKCCTTELKTVQLDDAQKESVCISCEPLAVHELIPFSADNTQQTSDPFVFNHFLVSFSPPPSDDLCVVHSVFLI